MAIFISAGIYKITSPSNKVYIGQSSNIKLRWQGHKSKAKYNRYKCKLYNSFKKYGFDNHIFEVIHYIDNEVPQHKFDKIEQYYINYYQSKGVELLNMKEAGCYGKHTEETKEKLRKLNTGKTLSDETKVKIGNKSRGNKYRLGTKHSEKTIIEKSKPVIQYSLEGEFIAEFIGAKDAERKTGVFQSGISLNCRGVYQTAGGFKWEFKQIK